MVADSKGRDVEQVLIYVTGHAAFAPVSSSNVVPKASLGSSSLTVPSGFKYMGLRTSDGGPEASVEAGETIELLEDGFVINGDGTISVQMTLAQFNPSVRALIRDSEPDANGVIEVRKATPDTQYILLLEGVYKSGMVKREHGVARIAEVSLGKEERNSVNGVTVKFTWVRHELFNRSYFWEAIIDGEAVEMDPRISGVTPSGQSAGQLVTISGVAFSGATAVTFDSIAATNFAVVSDSAIVATLPADDAGSVPVVVTTPEGTSESFTYTRA